MDPILVFMLSGFFLIPAIVAGVMIFFGVRAIGRYKLIQRTPTRMSVDVEEGMTEVKGKVQHLPSGYLTSSITSTPCVYYESLIEERVSSGKHSHWVTRFSEKRGTGFLVKDESGLTRVRLEGADMDLDYVMNEVPSLMRGISEDARIALTRRNLPLKGPLGILHKTYRVREKVIPLNRDIYVLGTASEMGMEPSLEGNPIVNPYTIAKGKVLIISTKDEETLAGYLMMRGIFLIGGGVAIAAGGLFFVLTLISNLI